MLSYIVKSGLDGRHIRTSRCSDLFRASVLGLARALVRRSLPLLFGPGLVRALHRPTEPLSAFAGTLFVKPPGERPPVLAELPVFKPQHINLHALLHAVLWNNSLALTRS